MKNRAIDSTSEILSADQVSMCRSCSRARRGPRLLPIPRPRPRAGVVASAADAAAAPDTVRSAALVGGGTGGTGGAPGGPPAGWAGAPDDVAVDPSVGLWARWDPVVGIDCVAETGVGSRGAPVSVGAAVFPALS